MVVGIIHNSVILLEREKKKRIEFQVFPDRILDNKVANWTDVTIVGRSEPIKTYAGSGSRILSFPLMFVASVDQNDGGRASDVKRNIEFLQSLVYPETTPGGIAGLRALTIHPPVVWLVVADLINARGVIRSVNVQWLTPYTVEEEKRTFDINQPPIVLWHYFSLPILAQAQIQFEEVNDTPHDSAYVREGRPR